MFAWCSVSLRGVVAFDSQKPSAVSFLINSDPHTYARSRPSQAIVTVELYANQSQQRFQQRRHFIAKSCQCMDDSPFSVDLNAVLHWVVQTPESLPTKYI